MLAAAVVLASCGGSGAPMRPEPTLAESLDAQARFQPIRSQWMLSTRRERVALEARLETFRKRFRVDPLARVALAYLAFIALDRGDLERANRLAHEVEKGPRGNTRDLGTLVDGATLARAGKPEEALRRLDPLVGRMIDPFSRDLLNEAVVEAAVDAQRWYQATIYMNEWFHGTNEQDLPALRDRVDALLVRFPPESLESVLGRMGAAAQDEIWERGLREAIAARLAAVAMERSDAKLAKSVLETSRGVVGMEQAGASLAQLAVSGGHAARIVGARVGLLLETEPRVRAARSAEAVSGALEIFKPGRTADGATREPGSQPPVLITHAAPSQGDPADALDDLAYQGASIIIGGYDPERSAELASYAESRSIAVILLVAPRRLPEGAHYSFVAGLDGSRWAAPAPHQAAHQVDLRHGARVAWVLGEEKPDGPMTASCARSAGNALGRTFPVVAWRGAGVNQVAVDGPAWCAQRVLLDLDAARFSPTLFLGLEAREAARSYPGELRVASCGYLDALAQQRPPELKAWRANHGGPPTWFQALGRDAALLAHDAVDPLPRGTFTQPDEVKEARRVVQQGLLRVEAPLWTTTERGLAGTQALTRRVRYVKRQ